MALTSSILNLYNDTLNPATSTTPSSPSSPLSYTGTFDLSQVVTLDPENMDITDPYYLGTGANLAIAIVTLILCVIAVTLNTGVLKFFRNQVEDVVPFMCYLLSMSDLAVGICAGLHSILFIVIIATQGSPPVGIMGIAAPAHYFSFVAFKVSVFVSMVFAVVRSINMNTFLSIWRTGVAIAIFIWLSLWSIISLVEIAFYIMAVSGAEPSPAIPKHFLLTFFYQPGKPKVVEMIVSRFFSSSTELSSSGGNLECTAEVLYTALPLILCVLPTLLALIHQLYLHVFRQMYRGEDERRKMTVTVMLLEVLFMVTALCTLKEPITTCTSNMADDPRNLYLLGYIPFFVRAALDPLVLLIGIRPLRKCMWKCMFGRDSCKQCSSIKYDPVRI